MQLKSRPEAPREGRRTFLILGSIAVLLTLAIGAYRIIHPKTATLTPFTPSVGVWNRDDCLQRNFSDLMITDGDDVNYRKQQEAWYCAHQWDESFIANSARLLETSQLLPVQWHSGHELDRTFYEAVPASAASFAKIFDAGRLLLVNESDYQAERSELPGLPSVETFRNVKAKIGLDRTATMSKPLPQIYNVNPSGPSINLVSDLGVSLSLEETVLFIEASVEGRLFAEMDKAHLLGVRLEGNGMWMNPTVFPVAVVLQAMLNAASEQRKALGLKPLPDLEILYLSDELVDPKSGLSHREGYFDPTTSRIYVHLSADPHLPQSPPRDEVSRMVGQVLPAPLEHEFFHYLFYRPELAGSAFILEGEATANGERLHQGFVAGANLESDASPRLRELVRKMESGGNLNAEETSEYAQLEQTFLSRQPLTRTQCESFALVYQEHIVAAQPMNLDQLLPVRPSDFNRNNPALGYAQAWAVYHVALLEGNDWEKSLERLYFKIAAGRQLTPTDSALLKQIAEQTISWVKSNADIITKSCGT